MTVDPATAIVSALSVGSVWTLGWWLRGQFNKIDSRSEARWMEHESKDQGRHEDNLRRFGNINAALASLGWQSRNHDR